MNTKYMTHLQKGIFSLKCYFSILTTVSIIICYSGLGDIPRTQGQVTKYPSLMMKPEILGIVTRYL